LLEKRKQEIRGKFVMGGRNRVRMTLREIFRPAKSFIKPDGAEHGVVNNK
jgi:hypothetical protein